MAKTQEAMAKLLFEKQSDTQEQRDNVQSQSDSEASSATVPRNDTNEGSSKSWLPSMPSILRSSWCVASKSCTVWGSSRKVSSCTYPTVLQNSSGLTSQLCTVARCGSKMANCVAYTVVQIKSQSTYDLQLVCSERYWQSSLSAMTMCWCAFTYRL